MYEQYVLDLLSDVFFCGEIASHLVKTCLWFWKSQTSHFGNPRALILEIPDLSLWKTRTS